jgi:uncharacterized protein YbjT (DUF2867 family)
MRAPWVVLDPVAHGRVGGALADALAQRAAADPSLVVRLGARRPRRPGIVPCTYGDEATTAAALAGVHALFLAAPSDDADVGPLLACLAQAAASGVRRVVLLSADGVDVRPHPMQALEAAVRASGLAWTILRPNTFMQNYATGTALDGLRSRRAILEPAGTGRSAFVDVRDVADVAAAVLAAPEAEHATRHAGRTYVLTGPEALDRAAVAAAFTAALGEPVTYIDAPPQAFAALLAASGAPDPLITMLGGFYGDIRAGRMAALSDDVATVTGAVPRPFAAFATEVARALRPPRD